jgi:hypothetical protein
MTGEIESFLKNEDVSLVLFTMRFSIPDEMLELCTCLLEQ